MKKSKIIAIIIFSLVFLSYLAQAATYYYRVKAVNSYGESPYSNEATIDVTLPCAITAAYWNPTNAIDGDSVELILEGTNCNGASVDFEIFENDAFAGDDFLDDPVASNPAPAVFSGGRAVAIWTAKYIADFSGDPEYYFGVTVAGERIPIRSAQDLTVSQLCTTCAPEINVPSFGSIALVPGSAKELAFEFDVKGDVASINDGSASVKFSRGTAERASSGCSLVSPESGRKKFTCTVTMQYYDEPGEWGIDISINDNTGNAIRNNTEKFIVEELRDISLNSRSVNFQTIKSGAANVIAAPVTISNNGNYGSSIKITAHNLHGSKNSNEFIDASLFKVGTTATDACNSGVSAVNGTEITVAGSSLPAGASSSEELYYCLSSAGEISSQEYATLSGFGWKIGLA